MNTSTTETTTPKLGVDRTDLGDQIVKAIASADYANQGAPFEPFLVKFADSTKFVNGWTAERGNAISFYGQYQGDSTEFLPLGDYATVNGTPIEKTPIMLLAPMAGHEDALAHPLGFGWLLDDIHSGNGNDIAYFWPQAPAGYQALGICVGFNGQTPDLSKYWCVKTEYLQNAPTQPLWSDAGSHWTSHNGSLSQPSLAGQRVQNDKFLLTPTTMLSDARGDFQNSSWCLALTKLMLPVAGASTVNPTYDPSNGAGATTAPGLGKVAVLPVSLIDDPASNASPFYYLAAQPYWSCLRSFSSEDGGTFTDSITIGTSAGTSSGFQHTTSLEVGAEVGIEAGGFSAKASVKYTDEMQLSGSTTSSSSTEVTRELKQNLPNAKIVQFWQKQTDFVVYRTAGDVMSVVTFEMADTLFVKSTP